MQEITPDLLAALVREHTDCTMRDAVQAVNTLLAQVRESAQPPAGLRDKFAHGALDGMLSHATRYRPRPGASKNWHKAISEEAYEIADAMLEARKPKASPMVDYDLAVRAGYGAFQRQTHVGTAWDITWPGKTGMDNSMYKTERDAREAALTRFKVDAARARELLALIA